MVEARVWGLDALKHILRMRLALQGSIQLTRPVNQWIDMPQPHELLAANLTSQQGQQMFCKLGPQAMVLDGGTS